MYDLKAMIEAVEAGDDECIPAMFNFCEQIGYKREYGYTLKGAYHGSMDAALALFKELLPGWTWGTAVDAYSERYAWVSDGTPESEDEHYNPDPARALLLATLKAVEAGKN